MAGGTTIYGQDGRAGRIHIKKSLTEQIQSQYTIGNISEEEKEILVVMVNEIKLPTIKGLIENSDKEQSTDLLKMQLIYELDKRLRDSEWIIDNVLSDYEIEKYE